MADSPNYTLHAFKEPLHLVALVALTVTLAYFLGATGLGIAAALEVAYLVAVPRMIPYKRRAQLAHQLGALEDRPAQREREAASLTREVRRRYGQVQEVYAAARQHAAQLPVRPADLESLMDAALQVAQILEREAEAERRQPLDALRAEGSSDRLAQREELKRNAGAARAQLDEIEATLQRLVNVAHGAALDTSAAQALSQDVEAAARTAREMAAFQVTGSGR